VLCLGHKTSGGCEIEVSAGLRKFRVIFNLIFMEYNYEITSRYSFGLDGRGSNRGRGKVFIFTASRPAVGPTRPPIHWILEEKRPGREADHSHLVPRSRMMDLCHHSPILLHGIVLNKLSTGTTSL
jgi:hypothetical protein